MPSGVLAEFECAARICGNTKPGEGFRRGQLRISAGVIAPRSRTLGPALVGRRRSPDTLRTAPV